MNKILIVPPLNNWYMEVHAEYLIRYLSNEFFIEVADVPYPPYDNFLDRFPETNPFQRNPDDYDLIWPILPSHWVIMDKDKYAHKVATVFYQPNEGRSDVAVVGATTPLAEASLKDKPFHKLRFGVDTNLFKPLNFKKGDKLNVGIVGSLNNPRRITKELWQALKDVEGVNLMLFPSHRLNEHDIDLLGGREILKNIVSGDKSWPGIANVYNRFDVLIRIDLDPGYEFPVIDAASCGVPVISTDGGIASFITNTGGGILIEADKKEDGGSTRAWYQANIDEVAKRTKNAVIYMRDHENERKMMGLKARSEIFKNWTWEKTIPGWREFFREGIRNVKRNI